MLSPPQDAATALVNLAEKDKTTPLMRACQNGHYMVAEKLIANGAFLDVQRDGTMRTALILACRNGFLRCVQLLLGHHADVTIGDQHQLDALLSAASYGHNLVIQALVEDSEYRGNRNQVSLDATQRLGR